MIPFSVNMRIQVCKNSLKQLRFFIHQVLAKDTNWVFIIISKFYRLRMITGGTDLHPATNKMSIDCSSSDDKIISFSAWGFMVFNNGDVHKSKNNWFSKFGFNSLK